MGDMPHSEGELTLSEMFRFLVGGLRCLDLLHIVSGEQPMARGVQCITGG